MKIQKGIVKYKDRNDIVCCYGVADDGKQYYFLDESGEKKLSNGNRIASTALVEAIDPMIKASSIGVVSENGQEIIPFVNKMIKPVNEDILLVELANPKSASVQEAIKLKSDPLAATRLVSTPALIKDKLNAKMGPTGRYLFNDQFSEATVCDINGHNLVNDEYYSFIGISNGKLYFSKNSPDSEITEYSILPPAVQSDITPSNDTNEIDVKEAVIPEEVVEDAMKEENVLEEEKPQEMVQNPLPEEVSTPEEIPASEEQPIEEVKEDVSELAENNTDAVSEEEMQINFPGEQPPVEETLDEEEPIQEENTEPNDLDIFGDSILEEDTIPEEHYNTYEDVEGSGDSIMSDVAKSMSNLIKQNKEQKELIVDYQKRIEDLDNFKRTISEKVKSQKEKMESLTARLKKYETTISLLEAKTSSLEDKIGDQQSLIDSQNKELNSLRPQLQGKEDLVKLLADAQVLLDEEPYKYDSEEI